MEVIKQFLRYIRSTEVSWSDAGKMVPLLPGAALVLVGIVLLYAPSYLVLAISGFFLCLGAAMMAASWKMLVLARRFKKMASDFEAQIYVRSSNIRAGGEEFDRVPMTASEHKKIVYH